MYDEIYQEAFGDELQKIAALGGFAGNIAAGAQKIGLRFLRKARRLPRSFGARTERLKRFSKHTKLEQRAMAPKMTMRGGNIITTPRTQFSMGSQGDLIASYHRGLAQKNLQRTGLPALGRNVMIGGAGIGLAGGGAVYLNSRRR